MTTDDDALKAALAEMRAPAEPPPGFETVLRPRPEPRRPRRPRRAAVGLAGALLAAPLVLAFALLGPLSAPPEPASFAIRLPNYTAGLANPTFGPGWPSLRPRKKRSDT